MVRLFIIFCRDNLKYKIIRYVFIKHRDNLRRPTKNLKASIIEDLYKCFRTV